MGQIRVLVFTEVVMSGKPIIRSISGLCRKDGRGLSLKKSGLRAANALGKACVVFFCSSAVLRSVGE
jgi:hypothetical protein